MTPRDSFQISSFSSSLYNVVEGYILGNCVVQVLHMRSRKDLKTCEDFRNSRMAVSHGDDAYVLA